MSVVGYRLDPLGAYPISVLFGIGGERRSASQIVGAAPDGLLRLSDVTRRYTDYFVLAEQFSRRGRL